MYLSIYISIKKEIYYKVLPLSIMQTEKSRYLPSANELQESMRYSSKAWESGSWMVQTAVWVRSPENQIPKGRRRLLSRSSSQAESEFNLPFCSIRALNSLNDAHSHWGEPSASLSSPIQMLISSRNTITDTPRYLAIPVTWKIIHHKLLLEPIDEVGVLDLEAGGIDDHQKDLGTGSRGKSVTESGCEAEIMGMGREVRMAVVGKECYHTLASQPCHTLQSTHVQNRQR